MSAARVPLTPEARNALRRRCTLLIGGPPEHNAGDDLIAAGEWCRAQSYAPDRYGEGPIVADFEAKIAALLGFEAAVFMPSGTMAQQIALRIHAAETGIDAFAMHPTSHLELHEERAYSRVQRLDGVLLGPGDRPTLAADLAAWPERLSALLVELPAREIGGQLPAWEELSELAALARARNVRLHMDGARLWEAREAYAPRSYADICALFDTVYVSFYKGIGAIAGAALAGSKAFVAQASLWRKRMGGTLVHLYPYVASAAMRFDGQLARVPAWRTRAISLAQALAQVRGVRILPYPPQVNMFHVHFSLPAEALAAARDALAERDGVWIGGRFTVGTSAQSAYMEMYVGESLCDIAEARVATAFEDLLAIAQDAP